MTEVTLGTWRIFVERGAPNTELAAMYDEAGERWQDRLTLFGYPQGYEDLFDRLPADRVLNSLRDGGRILDCGIGKAAFSLALAGKVAAPVQTEGVDISPDTLLRAWLNLDRVGVENRMHLHAIKDLPFDDSVFEGGIGAHVLELLLDPFVGLTEMARVLKLGGPLVTVVFSHSIPDRLSRVKWFHERIGLQRPVFEMEEVGLTSVRAYPLLAGGPLPAGRALHT